MTDINKEFWISEGEKEEKHFKRLVTNMPEAGILAVEEIITKSCETCLNGDYNGNCKKVFSLSCLGQGLKNEQPKEGQV